MPIFSTIDALSTLTSSIPNWNQRLDDLNGQISLRQVELAQLQEQQRPPTAHSLRNKGSTESLRPKDAIHESAFPSHNADDETTGKSSPDPPQNSQSPKPRPGSPAAARTAAASSSPVPVTLARNSSQPTPPPAQPRKEYNKLRKRKTESLASGDSGLPKYRTRSMIIVYYDSAVQTAFEDLVKFVSGSRNSMRKGKMAAKMAEMRRAAEMEVDDEEDEDDEDNGRDLSPFKSNSTLSAQKNVVVRKEGESGDADGDDDGEYAMPKLKFLSTRQMGPSRDKAGPIKVGDTPGIGMLRGYRRSGAHGAPDIFDELDKGLEWCQSQCEHAAHQFLRDGDCSAEIENIKSKLAEVKEKAEKEVERLKIEGTSEGTSRQQKPVGKPRGLSSIKVRKELSQMKDLEVDDGKMEVDEGIEDDDGPPTLVFKKARDYAR